MKPTKNRVFCPYSNKHKMVFETEKKALNHIRFNASDYEGDKIPVRAYFCSACGGWHLTSQEARHPHSYSEENKQVMTYSEFVERTACPVLPEDFQEIHKMYLEVPDSKDTFCRKWIRKHKLNYIKGLVEACQKAGVTKTLNKC